MKSIQQRNKNRKTTGRDPDVDLDICDKCGWWCKRVGQFSNNECDPALGAVADSLVARLPNIPSTKLGSGHGALVFEPIAGDVDLHVRFDVTRNGRGKPFAVRDVWLLGRVSEDAAADLVQTIAAWRKRYPHGGAKP